MKLASSSSMASELNIVGREKEFFAPLLSKAQHYLAMGILTALLGVWGLLDRRIRNVETLLPDVIPDEEEVVPAAAD